MDHAAHVDAVEAELARLLAAVADGPLDAAVPTCPGFTVDDLGRHVGEFCGFWTHVLCEGTGREKPPYADEVGAHGRAAWLGELAGHLVAELAATPPDTAVWTWYPPDRSAAFVARRCAHELAIHRVDAQLARGAADPIDAPLAADGIEELLFVLASEHGDDRRRGAAAAGQTLHLHGTDHEPAEWLVTLDADGLRVAREHAKGDLALRGAVGDLELLLYQRPPVADVERFGDADVLEAFHDEFTFT